MIHLKKSKIDQEKAKLWGVENRATLPAPHCIVTLAQALICIFPFSGCQHIIFFSNIFVFVDKPHMYVVIPVNKMIIYMKFLDPKPFVYICAIKYLGGVRDPYLSKPRKKNRIEKKTFF